MRILSLILLLAALILAPAVHATEDETGGAPSPAPAPGAERPFLGQTAPNGVMTHMPSSDPYCWQLWTERAAAHQAICGNRPCPPRRAQGCTVAWWVGSCRSSTISCQLSPLPPPRYKLLPIGGSR